MSSSKQTQKKSYGIHHFINGVWTISIIDNFVCLYKELKTFSYLRANIFILAVGILCCLITSHYAHSDYWEYLTLLSFITLTVTNLISVLIGVYSSILLMPTHISLFIRAAFMVLLLTTFLVASYQSSKASKQYKHARSFDFMESFSIGLNGLSIFEELIFIMQNTELMLLPLLLPLHQSITLGACFCVFSAISICVRFYANNTFREAFLKGDFSTFLFYCAESEVIALTLISVLVTIWFNFLLLPFETPLLGFSLSILATLVCSAIYYKAEEGFLNVTAKHSPLKPSALNSGSPNSFAGTANIDNKKASTFIRSAGPQVN